MRTGGRWPFDQLRKESAQVKPFFLDMKMSDSLIPLESVNALEVFTGRKLDDLLAAIRKEAVSLAIAKGLIPAVSINY